MIRLVRLPFPFTRYYKLSLRNPYIFNFSFINVLGLLLGILPSDVLSKIDFRRTLFQIYQLILPLLLNHFPGFSVYLESFLVPNPTLLIHILWFIFYGSSRFSSGFNKNTFDSDLLHLRRYISEGRKFSKANSVPYCVFRFRCKYITKKYPKDLKYRRS